MMVTEQTSVLLAREVVADCERLCLDYAHFVDAGRMDEWAGLFADDAELVLFGKTHKGRAAIRAAVGAGSGATMHVTSNIRVTPLGPDEAEGSAYVAAYARSGGERPAALSPVAVGVYRDRYRRTPDGWRFALRAFEPFLVAGGG